MRRTLITAAAALATVTTLSLLGGATAAAEPLWPGGPDIPGIPATISPPPPPGLTHDGSDGLINLDTTGGEYSGVLDGFGVIVNQSA